MADDRWPRAVNGCPVVAVVTVDDDAVILLDPDARPEGVEQWHPYQNLVRLSRDGSVVWVAELVPNETTAKCYLGLVQRDGDLVASTYSFEATLDPQTGRIQGIEFTK